jgi:predicted MPP superfamily phosphohydrolase
MTLSCIVLEQSRVKVNLPIEWSVSYERLFSVPDITGAFVCLLGTIAQAFIGRRLNVRPLINYSIALGILFIYFCDEENMIPAVRRMLPEAYRADWIPALLSLWSIFAIGVAILMLLRGHAPAFRSDRREFLKKTTAVLCVAPAAVLAAGVITRKNFHIREIDLKFPNLPKDLQGLRLLQLSDIHIGTFFTANDLARVVEESNNLRPDLAFITADLITTRGDPLDRCLLELHRLRSASGIWGCMGNHERFAKVQNYTQAKARELEMHFLRHEAASVKFGDHRINVVGVDYQPGHTVYLENVEELVSKDSFNLLLSHNPDVFPVAAQKGFDLTLAGHTHGGQINVEILGENLNIADFFTPYTKGLYASGSSSVYVNSGLGTIGMPVRIGAPPEITLIRLCSS